MTLVIGRGTLQSRDCVAAAGSTGVSSQHRVAHYLLHRLVNVSQHAVVILFLSGCVRAVESATSLRTSARRWHFSAIES